MTDTETQQPLPSQSDDQQQISGAGGSLVRKILRRCRPLKEQQQQLVQPQQQQQQQHQQHQQQQQHPQQEQEQEQEQQKQQQQQDGPRACTTDDVEKPTLDALAACMSSTDRPEARSGNNDNCVAAMSPPDAEPAGGTDLSETDQPAASHNTPNDADTAGADTPDGAENGEEAGTETKTSGDATGQSQQQAKPKTNKTRAQIFLANEAAARKRAEKYWTVDTEGYNFKDALYHYTNVDKHIKPKDMKYIVDHREKQMCDEFGKVMRTVVRGAIHPLIDNVVSGFCERMGMSETQKVPTVEERMFLWFHRERALKLMRRMGPKKQVYFLNYITWDHVLTDLQSLNSRLSHCSLREGQTYPEHYCHDVEKIREVFQVKFNAKPDTPLPKMLFIDQQSICPHIFESQEFNKACEEKECPNYGKRMCRCFQLGTFMPETMVLATKRQFETVLKNFLDDKYFSQRWLIRASNLKGGNGVQFIDSAAELETFLRYDIRRNLRGQFFIMQRYLKNPMLFGLRRFDCRMFLLICVLSDRRVVGFLHPGYVREAQKDFDPASNDLRCHLTLPFTWDPDYNRYKGNNPEKLPDYCHPYSNVCKDLELPQLDFRTFDEELRTGTHFIAKLNCIVQEIVRSMESIIYDKPGTWQLFGLDLAVDSEKNPWLYDVMTYPSTDEPDFFSETQNKMLPAIFTEALTIIFELNQRDFATRLRLEWMDLPDIPWNKPGLITAQQNFIWLYSTSPDKLLSYKETRQVPRLHWYHQWRVAEDFNDYILYLKNFRLDSIIRMPDNNVYGRKTFDHSPIFKLKQQLKKTGFKPQ